MRTFPAGNNTPSSSAPKDFRYPIPNPVLHPPLSFNQLGRPEEERARNQNLGGKKVGGTPR